MKKVVVVGGAGYVGCVLVPELLARGWKVKVIDIGMFGFDGLPVSNPQLDVVVKSQRQIGLTDLQGFDALVLIGGLSNDPMANMCPKANHLLNCDDMVNLAGLAGLAQVERVVFGSSASVYDRGVFSDNMISYTEDSDVSPTANYAVAKRGAELGILALVEEYSDTSYVILRKGTLYGQSPRMRYDLVVNTFVMKAFTEGVIIPFFCGKMWRPLCSVRDAAVAYLLALNAPSDKVSGEIFNIVSGNHRISELALEVAEYLLAFVSVKVKPSMKYAPVRSYSMDGSKACSSLLFSPQYSLKEEVFCMAESIVGKDLHDTKYYNIRMFEALTHASRVWSRNPDLDVDTYLEENL